MTPRKGKAQLDRQGESATTPGEGESEVIVDKALNKLPEFGQWPATLIVIVGMLLATFVYTFIRAIDSVDRLTTEINTFRVELGGGTDRIVQEVGKVHQEVGDLNGKIDLIPMRVVIASRSGNLDLMGDSDERPDGG